MLEAPIKKILGVIMSKNLSQSPPRTTDLTAIAAMLSQAAQALLNFGKVPEAEPMEDYADDEESSGPIEADYKRGQFHEEIRCYRLPQNIVKREYELLLQHKQDKFSHLVNRVYNDLSAITLLMRHFDESADISGFELHLISESLSRPLGLLNTVCSQLADFKLVQKTTIPT